MERNFTGNVIFEQLVTPQLFTQLSKMRRFQNEIKDRPWHVDVNLATLSVEGLGQFPIRVVGAENNNNFTWAWAITDGLDHESIAFEAVNRIRKYGQQHDIDILTKPEVKFEKSVLFSLLVSYGYGEDYATYAANMGEGQGVFYLIAYAGEILRRQDDITKLPELCQLAGEISGAYKRVSGVQLDLKRSLKSYLDEQGFDYEVSEENTIKISNSGALLDMRFSADGQILADLPPEMQPA